MMITYEQKLDADVRWAFMEGSSHFGNASAVHKTLARFARRLDELKIPYAVTGAMALFFHGYRHFTEDVDLLVTQAGMEAIRSQLDELDCWTERPGSNVLRDRQTGVAIDLHETTSELTNSVVNMEGMRILSLPCLVETKIRSGTARRGRLMHLCDIQALLERVQLPESFVTQLSPPAQAEFHTIWWHAHGNSFANAPGTEWARPMQFDVPYDND